MKSPVLKRPLKVLLQFRETPRFILPSRKLVEERKSLLLPSPMVPSYFRDGDVGGRAAAFDLL